MPDAIPFNRPALVGNELDYMRQAVESGHTSAKGAFTERVAGMLRESHGAADVLLTTSCTDALEMAALLLDLGPDDEVVVPSFTFVSTALAFARTGARLVFADVEGETLGIDPASVAERITPDARVVVPVHYAGVGVDMEALSAAMASSPRAEIVEDNAHGLFGAIGDRPLGTFGRLSALSFHETKNFVCGEGGALVVNDPDDVMRAHTILDKGTNRRAFMLGQVDKYSWQDIGSSFGLSDLNAAYLLAQLEAKEAVLAERKRVFDRYMAALEPYAAEDGFRVPVIPEDRTQGYHMFYVLLPDRDTRNRVLGDLREQGINATFHYVPLHSAPGAKRFTDREYDCPVTDDISGRLMRFPFYNDLSDGQIDRVVEAFLGAVGD
jgi:dTDP-4-amino-4,6-dideoxygalactose transaminase